MTSYENWSKEDLINHIRRLESQNNKALPPTKLQEKKRSLSKSSSRYQNPSPHRAFHFSSHPRRKIALKFCYSGWEYNGLAYQLAPTPLPTVEEVLFDALAKARLVDPAAGYDGCEWERCGRTDRGVSAAGQVVSLWVRSALGNVEACEPREQEAVGASASAEATQTEDEDIRELDDGFGSLDIDDDDDPPAPPITSEPKSRPEHDYVAILNRILPDSIRVLAWSPVSPSFSARFACKFRHYKYFFSSEHLDIRKMQDAASRLVGDHDFRNLCKVDAGKQITVFVRKILKAELVPVEGDETTSGMYVLNLVGTAFLYHQVRHMMAVLLMVGRGLEEPSVVTSLLNVNEGAERARAGEPLEVVDRKPEYQMADALPLVLWDCGYSNKDVEWRTDDYGVGPTDAKTSTEIRAASSSSESGRGLYHLLHSIHGRSQIFTTLHRHFLGAASQFFSPPWTPTFTGQIGVRNGDAVSWEVPLGGGTSRKLTQYVPLLKRNRLDTVEAINKRWKLGKGFRRDERKRTAGDKKEEDDGDE
ncbi:trna pseudouridine synthase 3 [Moniliophthora roreri]|uniref:Pseudouridine synthase I TruA alpha/beta domain-containing protein n=1 Tax=Moniliophthora roreri TaxID=221103 RepID=A0A0W0FM29_MONRR|nr:trna pseudouridine synthase 3 [Moniliophthora roreri]